MVVFKIHKIFLLLGKPHFSQTGCQESGKGWRGRGWSRSRFMENKMVLSQVTGNEIGISQVTGNEIGISQVTGNEIDTNSRNL